MAIYKVSSNQSDEWYTPKSVMDKVKIVLGEIDIDPASNPTANKIVGAKTYYTEQNSGLDKTWDGKVFMNPPFSGKLIPQFTKKFLEEFEAGRLNEGIVLVNACTDPQWVLPLTKGTVAFTVGRIKFYKADGTVPKAGQNRGQMFAYFGENKDLFINTFTKDNFCWIPNV